MPVYVKRGTRFVKLILEQLNKQFASPDRHDSQNISVHVSDLIGWCMSKSVMQRTHPYLYYLTEEDLNNFTRGKLSELAISQALKELTDAQRHMKFDDITASPDIVFKDNSIILELKDTNNWSMVSPYDDTNKMVEIDHGDVYQRGVEILKGEKAKTKQATKRKKYNNFPGYLTQLVVYMTIAGIENGSVIIRYNNHKFMMKIYGDKSLNGESPFDEWEIYLPLNDPIRKMIKDNLMLKKHFFVQAIREKDLTQIPRVKEYYTEGPDNAKCNRCCFKEECHKPIHDERLPQQITDLLDPMYIYNNLKKSMILD